MSSSRLESGIPRSTRLRFAVGPIALPLVVFAAFGAACSSPAPEAAEPRTESQALSYCPDTCHGACGSNCDACVKTYDSQCELDNYGRNTGWAQKYETDVCGTAAGCRQHDDCLQNCANNSNCNWSPYSTCAISCDATIAAQYPPWDWSSWMNGGGPYDGTLRFRYDAGRTWSPSQCPLPQQCTGTCADGYRWDNNLCACVSVCGPGQSFVDNRCCSGVPTDCTDACGEPTNDYGSCWYSPLNEEGRCVYGMCVSGT